MEIGQKISWFFRTVADLFRAKPWTLAVLVIAIALLFFFRVFFFEVFILVGISLAIIFVILTAVLLAIKLRFKEPSMKELLEQRGLLQEELRIAEVKMLRHQIDLKGYQSIVDRAQKAMVELEAKIAKESEKAPMAAANLQNVSTKKRHLLKELLERRKAIKDEISIAEAKYFKRKINAITYREILQAKQQELIGLEAEIKKFFASEVIEQIKKDLAEKMRKLEEDEAQQKNSYAEEIVEDVSEQEKKIEKQKPGEQQL